MKNLQNSDYFQNVKLKVIKQEDVSSLQLRKFEITSTMNFMGNVKKPQNKNNGQSDSNNRGSEI